MQLASHLWCHAHVCLPLPQSSEGGGDTRARPPGSRELTGRQATIFILVVPYCSSFFCSGLIGSNHICLRTVETDRLVEEEYSEYLHFIVASRTIKDKHARASQGLLAVHGHPVHRTAVVSSDPSQTWQSPKVAVLHQHARQGPPNSIVARLQRTETAHAAMLGRGGHARVVEGAVTSYSRLPRSSYHAIQCTTIYSWQRDSSDKVLPTRKRDERTSTSKIAAHHV